MIDSQQIKQMAENHDDLERLMKSLLSEEEVSMRVYSAVTQLMSCHKTAIELVGALYLAVETLKGLDKK
jgi:hypothetical protein